MSSLVKLFRNVTSSNNERKELANKLRQMGYNVSGKSYSELRGMVNNYIRNHTFGGAGSRLRTFRNGHKNVIKKANQIITRKKEHDKYWEIVSHMRNKLGYNVSKFSGNMKVLEAKILKNLENAGIRGVSNNNLFKNATIIHLLKANPTLRTNDPNRVAQKKINENFVESWMQERIVQSSRPRH